MMEVVMSGRKLTRREFLRTGILVAFGAQLAACNRLGRLVDTPPPEATSTLIPTPEPSPSPTEKPTLIAEAAPTPTSTPKPTDQVVPTLELHEAMFYRQLDGELVQCQMCFRTCIVPEGKRGFCRNKVNINGRYYTIVYGNPRSLQIDPIEKEPHYHMLPGGIMLCTGTASCNNRCKFCQNWHLSQQTFEEIRHLPITPDETVAMAIELDCHAVSFTYNEPTVFYEHMFDVAKAAKRAGLGTLFHTNGGMNEEPLAALLEYMDAVTVDLKAFTHEFYRQVSSSELEPVLRTLKQIHNSDAHLEIVNLVVTTLNDDMDDIRRMCQWIGDTLSDEVPLHFTRFFPAYKLISLPATPIQTLESAARIADEEGLKYIYLGNVPGHVRNSTFCPECGERIISRIHFFVGSLNIKGGKCRFCGHTIPGIWWDT
jgi:pyruvate formate lyase activating enzyme